jgi:hypothetical protein
MIGDCDGSVSRFSDLEEGPQDKSHQPLYNASKSNSAFLEERKAA